MIPNMNGLHRIFLLVIAFALVAAAQDQDLIVNTLDGALVVSGSPTLRRLIRPDL